MELRTPIRVVTVAAGIRLFGCRRGVNRSGEFGFGVAAFPMNVSGVSELFAAFRVELVFSVFNRIIMEFQRVGIVQVERGGMRLWRVKRIACGGGGSVMDGFRRPEVDSGWGVVRDGAVALDAAADLGNGAGSDRQ